MKTIAIVIRKGGTAKTTTAVNLASALVKEGKKVLLVDLDAQANATTALGIYEPAYSVADVLENNVPAEKAIMTSAGIDILVGSTDMVKTEREMTVESGPYKFYKLKTVLESLSSKYDFTIIDTPPSDSVLVYNALIAADAYIMPAQTHTLAIKGIQQALSVIDDAKLGGAKLESLGILPTMYQANTNMGEMMIGKMRQMYGDQVLPCPIPLTIKATESQLLGIPLVDYQPDSAASEAYKQLAKIVIDHYEAKK